MKRYHQIYRLMSWQALAPATHPMAVTPEAPARAAAAPMPAPSPQAEQQVAPGTKSKVFADQGRAGASGKPFCEECEAKAKKRWAEVKMVSDDDGKPIANAPCTVALPDGQEIEAVTDGNGVVRVDEIDADAVEIRLADSDVEEDLPPWGSA